MSSTSDAHVLHDTTTSADSPWTADNQALLAAASKGKSSYVLELLQRGASPNARHGPEGRTALHAAAECGQLKVLKLLIEHGSDARACLDDGSTPMHLAARQGHVDAAAALLEAAPDILLKRDNSGLTPLHAAAANVHPAVMRLLLDAGSDVSALDNEWRTPLHLCSCRCHPEAASILVEAGANMNTSCLLGYTPLHYACEHKNLAVARVLLQAGAPVNAVSSKGRTPLHLACEGGWDADTRLVEALISSGALLEAVDDQGWMALHVVSEEDSVTRATCLLRANPAAQHVNAAGDNGRTPLHSACVKGHSRMVGLLLRAGADVAARDSSGYTPLHLALKHGTVVKQLQAAGADFGTADDNGFTLLHTAAEYGNPRVLQLLLGVMGAQPGGGAVDAVAGGLTPLHFAAEGGHTSCLKLLLAAGANASKLYGVEAEDGLCNDVEGASALHRAVQLKCAAVVPLLATPANMAHVWKGGTPLHLALAEGRPPGLAQALVAAGSPAGVANTAGATAMSLAARSSSMQKRELLPAMVRRECGGYKQLQQRRGVGGQQQPQQAGEEQQESAAVLAAVVDALSALLQKFAASGCSKNPDICMSCIQVILDVLGGAAASRLMQQVLRKCVAADAAAGEGSSCGVRVVKALSKGCSAALEPLAQQRQQVTNRLQQLVTQPCQQQPPAPQQQQGRGRRASGTQAERPRQGVAEKQLSAQAMAAAQTGGWQQFVQLWEHLMGLKPALADRLMAEVQLQQMKGTLSGMEGLSEALLGAWVAAQKEVAGRKVRELAEAVVSAAQAARQQQEVVGSRRLQRGGRSRAP